MSELAAGKRDEGARLLQTGDLEGAIQALQAALQEAPQDAQARSLLGIALARKGDYAGAIDSMEEAVRLQPADASAQFNLGLALQKAERIDEARAALQRALDLNPGHSGARDLLQRIGSAEPPAFEPAADAIPTFQPAPAPAFQPAVAGWPGAGAGAAADAPPPAFNVSASAATVVQSPAAAGMSYRPAPQVVQPPSTGQRIGRGLLWGVVFGQWWTLWTITSMFLWGHAGSAQHVAFSAIFYGVGYAFFGAIVGFILAFPRPSAGVAMGVGVGIGLVVCAIELLQSQNALMLVNVIFYFFTGRYIGLNVARRIWST